MINIIAAVSVNNVIGKNGKMPWSYPEDLKYFKKITMGNPIVMGRKTFESIGKPLPGRENIILTNNRNLKIKDVTLIYSIQELLSKYFNKNLFIIGGEKIFRQFLPITDKIYLTKINKYFDGDTFFPTITNNWVLSEQKEGKNKELKFCIYLHKKLFKFHKKI